MNTVRFLIFFCVTGIVSAQGALPPSVNRVLEGHGISPDGLSILVQEVGSLEPVLVHNPTVPRNPASTIKLLTTWVALDVLGPTYNWPTEIHFLGDWDGQELEGDLAIKGYGDPYLVTEEFWKLLRSLRGIGLENVRGDLVLDGSFFEEVNGDPGDFDSQPFRAYNVLPNALMVNYKTVRFNFLVDERLGAVRISPDPEPSNLEIQNRIRLGEGPCRGYQSGIAFDVLNPVVGRRVVFSGNFPESCGHYALSRSVLQHDTFTFGVFQTLWKQLGGRFSGTVRNQPVPENSEPAMVWRSRPLGEVIRSINKFSNNVMTRQLLYSLGAERGGPPGTNEKGVQAIENYLQAQGLQTASLFIDNGAGLSRATRISARLMADVLLVGYQSIYMPEFLASLSLGGLDGTTRGRFNGHPMEGRMHVKTGRLDHVSALAGYIHGNSGRTYVVVVMLNEADVHRGPGGELQDALLRWAFNLS